MEEDIKLIKNKLGISDDSKFIGYVIIVGVIDMPSCSEMLN